MNRKRIEAQVTAQINREKRLEKLDVERTRLKSKLEAIELTIERLEKLSSKFHNY